MYLHTSRYNGGHSGIASNIDGRKAVFLEHVRAVASYARKAHSVQPLMWDDMLRSVPVEELRRTELGRLVEPVVWAYGDSVDAQVGTGSEVRRLGRLGILLGFAPAPARLLILC